MDYSDIVGSLFAGRDYLSSFDPHQFYIETKTAWTTVYLCTVCSQQHSSLSNATNCCAAPAAMAPVAAEDKSEVIRDREITMDEARNLGLLDIMLRKRLRIEHMLVDYEWLNENCTGLYLVSQVDGAVKVGFELDEDYVLFKLKFHAA